MYRFEGRKSHFISPACAHFAAVGGDDRKCSGANVIGVDLDPAKLALAKTLGAVAAVVGTGDVVQTIKEITKGGAHVSLDALGHPVTMTNSILCLRPRGKHIQVGLMLGDHAAPDALMNMDRFQSIGATVITRF